MISAKFANFGSPHVSQNQFLETPPLKTDVIYECNI